MGAQIYTFVEHLVDDAWVEAPELRGSSDADLLDFLRGKLGGKRMPMNRGFPHDASPELETAIGDLGDEVSDCSWATLAEMQRRLPLDEARERKQLVGPLFYEEHRKTGAVRGTPWNERLHERLRQFGANLVSNAEMESYIAENPEAFANITDGEAKVFTVLVLSENVTEAVGLASTLTAMKALGDAHAVRLVWIVGTP